jgi:hypothetical protein
MGILDTIIQTKHTEALRSFDPEAIIEEILSSLKEREKQILMKRYGLKANEIKTLASIGAEHSLTRERVRQIEKDIIKAMRKTGRSHATLNMVREMLLNTLNEHGKVMAEETLLKVMGVKSEGDRNAIIFILHLMEEIDSYLHENYKKCWATVVFNKELLSGFTEEVHKLLENEGKPIQEAALIESLKQTEFYKANEQELTEKVLVNFLDLAEKVEKNVFGHWGLTSWKQIVPKDVGDKAYLVLKQHGKPEHYSVITDMINAAKFDGRTAYKETVHNELIKDNRFILIGRGIYALNEWGYKAGVVSDVIKEILQEAGKPLSKEKIIEEVLKRRHVKKNTILVGLSNKKLFTKVDKSLYALV